MPVGDMGLGFDVTALVVLKSVHFFSGGQV